MDAAPRMRIKSAVEEMQKFVAEFTIKRVMHRSKQIDHLLFEILKGKAPKTYWTVQLLPLNAVSRILGLELRARVFSKHESLYKVYQRGKYLGEFRITQPAN
jgi:hypothetical protein